MLHRFHGRFLSLCLCLSAALPVFADSSLRKITLLDTGNYFLNQQAANLLLPASLTDKDVLALRDHAHELMTGKTTDEWARLLRTVAWVHTHIQHDSFNQTGQTTSLQILQRAEQGERFSCVEYAKVLRDILNMQGMVARSIGLQSAAIAYGPLGSSHVAVEVWSNTHNKWVLLDAQWGVYALHKKKPLNVGELYQLLRKGKLDEVKFTAADGKAAPELDREYRQFVANYFGYMSFRIRSDNTVLNLVFPLAGRELPLTFQGLPKNNHIFSRNPADVYFPVNQAHAIIHFKDRDRSYQQFAQIEFKDEAEYLEKMPAFAPSGELEVFLDHNMPWFEHFEARLEQGAWQTLPANSIAWSLQPGQNRMQLRAVNAAGIKGPITDLQLVYE